MNRIVRDMPAENYHQLKSLSASGAWAMSEECPAKFWWSSPWNPEYTEEPKTHFDIGAAAHLAVLEPAVLNASVREVNFDDWRTKEARDLRDSARDAGLVPLLSAQLDTVHRVARSIEAHPLAASAFRGGASEVVMTWNDDETNVPCKARIDYLPDHGSCLIDLKTSACANPPVFAAQGARLGYHARAAWYLDGAAHVLGERPREYWFVVVEKEPPFLVSVCAYDIGDIEWGRMVNKKALGLFRRCMAAGEWPGYRDADTDRDRAFRINLPSWAVYRLQDRSEAGEFSRPAVSPNLLRVAERMFAPDEV